MHLNDNSLFCVLTSLDVMCSPNNLFMTDIMVSSLFRLIVQQFGIASASSASCIYHVFSILVHVHILQVSH